MSVPGHANAVVQVARFEVYPPTNPDRYVIAFNVQNPKNRSVKYFEGTIPIEGTSGLSDVDICIRVWNTLKKRVAEWYSTTNVILGHKFDVPESEFYDILFSGSNMITASNLALYGENEEAL